MNRLSLFRNFLFLLIPFSLLLTWMDSSAQGQELALNDAFELQNWDYWTPTGNLPLAKRQIIPFDILGQGLTTYAYEALPWTGYEGGLSQTIHVQAGMTYEVSADFAYIYC
jgi:hypothetical protein